MNIGKIYKFKYISKKKPYDKNPFVVLLAETKNKLFGINLNFVTIHSQKFVVKFINDEILKSGKGDIEKLIEANNKINEEQFFKILIMSNEDKPIMIDDKPKSKHSILKTMKKAVRIYSKKNITEITEMDYA